MSVINSKLVTFVKSFFGHKHKWQIVPGSTCEEDAGIGMPAIEHCEVICTVCGAKATKTTHAMYGTTITNIHI